jgi:multidrug resistance efflux pump
MVGDDRTEQTIGLVNTNAREGGRALPFPEIEVENRPGVYLASEAALLSAQSTAEQSRLAYESQINGVNTTVARLQAELRDAEYNLEETIVTAPTDGYVTQLFCGPA